MSLRAGCSILKRVVYLLDFLWYLLMGGGLYSLGAKEVGNGLILFLLSGVCFIGSYELGYLVQHLIIRQEIENATK